jgi:hypothetical protein
MWKMDLTVTPIGDNGLSEMEFRQLLPAVSMKITCHLITENFKDKSVWMVFLNVKFIPKIFFPGCSSLSDYLHKGWVMDILATSGPCLGHLISGPVEKVFIRRA